MGGLCIFFNPSNILNILSQVSIFCVFSFWHYEENLGKYPTYTTAGQVGCCLTEFWLAREAECSAR